MTKKLLASFLILGASAFAAETFKVDILHDCVVEGQSVKAGAYKVSFDNGKAVLKHGKDVVAVPAREVAGPYKVTTNELTFREGKDLKEIKIGGTNTRIVFDSSTQAQPGM